MGAGLALAALQAAQGLDHAPARLYVGMALTALDSDPQPVYFKGREAMAEILGVAPGEAGQRAVRRALHTLTQRRHIASERAAPGRNARHRLLDGRGGPLTPVASGIGGHSASPNRDQTGDAERPVSNSNEGRSASPVQDRMGDGQRRNGGRSASGMGDGQRPPEEERGTTEEETPPPPTRSCSRHDSWNHDEPCRACAQDRRAAEARVAGSGPSTMSPAIDRCSTKHRWMPAEPDGRRTCISCPTIWMPGEEQP